MAPNVEAVYEWPKKERKRRKETETKWGLSSLLRNGILSSPFKRCFIDRRTEHRAFPGAQWSGTLPPVPNLHFADAPDPSAVAELSRPLSQTFLNPAGRRSGAKSSDHCLISADLIFLGTRLHWLAISMSSSLRYSCRRLFWAQFNCRTAGG